MLYELPPFEHIQVSSVEEALAVLARFGDKAAVLAGATDLLGLLKDGLTGPGLPLPEILLDVKPIARLNRIAVEGQSTVIGAAVRLAQLAESEIIRADFPLLAQAAGRIGTSPIRNMGTLGGNLCQRPRCLYFRHPDFACFKKGGRVCFAPAGEHRDYHSVASPGRCVMAHPSDLAPALAALDASVVIAGPLGTREAPLDGFFLGPDQRRDTILGPSELVVEVRLPRPEPGTRQVFLKQAVRRASDFALASVAASAVMSRGVCRDLRIFLGGVAAAPLRAAAAEELLEGRRPDEGLIAEAAGAVLSDARPLPGNVYKIGLARALVRRALVSTMLQSEASPAFR